MIGCIKMEKLLFKSGANPSVELYETHLIITGIIFIKDKKYTFRYNDIKTIDYRKQKKNAFSTLFIFLLMLILVDYIPQGDGSVLSISLKETQPPSNFNIYLRNKEINFILNYVNSKLKEN